MKKNTLWQNRKCNMNMESQKNQSSCAKELQRVLHFVVKGNIIDEINSKTAMRYVSKVITRVKK